MDITNKIVYNSQVYLAIDIKFICDNNFNVTFVAQADNSSPTGRSSSTADLNNDHGMSNLSPLHVRFLTHGYHYNIIIKLCTIVKSSWL